MSSLSRFKIFPRALLTISFLGVSSVAFALPSVEIIPVAVWQGKTTRPWSVGLLRDLRKAFPGGRIAHAVNAASLTQTSERQYDFRSGFAEVVVPGDDVLMHLAPWRSLVETAGVTFKFQPTVFGAPIYPGDCTPDCGLDLSLRAFSSSEVRSIVKKSSDLLAGAGFGSPKAIIFDEGVVSDDIRGAAKSVGVAEDWSGIEMAQLRGNLSRFPIYQWNQENLANFNIKLDGPAESHGLIVDHVRFGIHAEIGDMESSVEIFKHAFETAKASNRTVRIPIIFNVEDLIHTYEFVGESLSRAAKMAVDAGLPVKEWSALNSDWDTGKIKPTKPVVTGIAFSGDVSTGEAEFIPDDEVAGEFSDVIPANGNQSPEAKMSGQSESTGTAH